MKDSPHLQNFPQLNAFHGKPGFISLIGHRGARGLMPENTIEGFEYILDNDIKAIEFDVLLTKDEIPVITHDFYLSKAITRNSEGNWLSKDGPRISDLTSSQLEMFDVGGVDKSSSYGRLYLEQAFLSDVRIPKLTDLLDLACLPKGQNLFLLLEIKSEPSVKKSTVIENIVFEIEKRSLSSRTVLHSFDWDLLEECVVWPQTCHDHIYLSCPKVRMIHLINLLKKFHLISHLSLALYLRPFKLRVGTYGVHILKM